MSHEHQEPATHCSCTGDHRRQGWRSRWAAIGAAMAVVAGVGGISWAGAANPQVTPAQTYITPCRIMDTRSPGTVGPRSTPLGTNETHTIQVTGTNGSCTIPPDAAGVVMNVTLVSPGQGGFITVFPAGATRPNSSNLNYVAGQAPTPNQVTVGLSADGKVSFFASAGPVNLVADIVGYTTAARLTEAQLTQIRWDKDRARPASFTVGDGPAGVAFDGVNIWIANFFSDNVSRIDAATGNIVGSPITVGDGPTGVAFDGTNIWVTNQFSNSVTRINTTTGSVVGTPITVGNGPTSVVFDGTNIWVANQLSDNVTRVNATTATVVGTPVATGDGAGGLAFDGTHIWVTNANADTVTRINATTATVVGAPIAVGDFPGAATFDGTNVWVANFNSDNVTRINATTATVVGTPVAAGDAPVDVAFDGTNIWVANLFSDNLTRVDAASGSVLGSPVTAGDGPERLAFDGANVWVTNFNSDSVSKLRAG